MPKDKWDKLGIVGGIVGGVLVPAAIFFVGYFLSEAEKEHSRLTTQAANLTSLIGHLSSRNTQQQQIATEVASYLASKGQLPEEIIPSLVRILKETTNADTARSATEAVLTAASSDDTVAREVQQQLKGIAPRVYFHIAVESQRAPARKWSSELVRAQPDLVVPGIERKRGPSRTELRFFKSADRDEAEGIQSTLRQLGLEAELVDLSRRYGNATDVRPRHFELWIGDDI